MFAGFERGQDEFFPVGPPLFSIGFDVLECPFEPFAVSDHIDVS